MWPVSWVLKNPSSLLNVQTMLEEFLFPFLMPWTNVYFKWHVISMPTAEFNKPHNSVALGNFFKISTGNVYSSECFYFIIYILKYHRLAKSDALRCERSANKIKIYLVSLAVNFLPLLEVLQSIQMTLTDNCTSLASNSMKVLYYFVWPDDGPVEWMQ